MKRARAEDRSRTESKKPAKRGARGGGRATRPSALSNSPAPITTAAAARNLPCANRKAAQVLITSPRNVRTLGWMRDSASQRTMRSIIQPKVTPINRVYVMSVYSFVDGGELEDLEILLAPGTEHPAHIPHFFPQQRASDR